MSSVAERFAAVDVGGATELGRSEPVQSYDGAVSCSDEQRGRSRWSCSCLLWSSSLFETSSRSRPSIEANGEMEWGRDFGMQSKKLRREAISAHDTPRWRARERCQLQRAQRGIGADHDTSLLATTATLPPPRPGGRADGRRHMIMIITLSLIMNATCDCRNLRRSDCRVDGQTAQRYNRQSRSR